MDQFSMLGLEAAFAAIFLAIFAYLLARIGTALSHGADALRRLADIADRKGDPAHELRRIADIMDRRPK